MNIAALRRYKQIKKFDKKIKFSDVKKALRKRNFLDVNRKTLLLKHADSISIDTGKLNKSAMLKKMSFYVDLKLKKIWKLIKTLKIITCKSLKTY